LKLADISGIKREGISERQNYELAMDSKTNNIRDNI
jgi:hypothetical protein